MARLSERGDHLRVRAPGGGLLCESVEALADAVETTFTPGVHGPEPLTDEAFGKSCIYCC